MKPHEFMAALEKLSLFPPGSVTPRGVQYGKFVAPPPQEAAAQGGAGGARGSGGSEVREVQMARDRMTAMFKKMDLGRTGVIDSEEFCEGLRTAGLLSDKSFDPSSKRIRYEKFLQALGESEQFSPSRPSTVASRSHVPTRAEADNVGKLLDGKDRGPAPQRSPRRYDSTAAKPSATHNIFTGEALADDDDAGDGDPRGGPWQNAQHRPSLVAWAQNSGDIIGEMRGVQEEDWRPSRRITAAGGKAASGPVPSMSESEALRESASRGGRRHVQSNSQNDDQDGQGRAGVVSAIEEPPESLYATAGRNAGTIFERVPRAAPKMGGSRPASAAAHGRDSAAAALQHERTQEEEAAERYVAAAAAAARMRGQLGAQRLQSHGDIICHTRAGPPERERDWAELSQQRRAAGMYRDRLTTPSATAQWRPSRSTGVYSHPHPEHENMLTWDP